MLEFSRLIFKLSVKSLQKSPRDWSLVTLGNLPGSVLPDISKSFLKTFLHRSLFRMNHSMKRIDWAGVRIWSNAISFLLATDAECKRRLCSIVSTMDAAAAILLSFWSRTRILWILLDIVLRWEGTVLKKSADINKFTKGQVLTSSRNVAAFLLGQYQLKVQNKVGARIFPSLTLDKSMFYRLCSVSYLRCASSSYPRQPFWSWFFLKAFEFATAGKVSNTFESISIKN